MGALPISVRPRITPGASRMPVERIGPQVVSQGGGEVRPKAAGAILRGGYGAPGESNRGKKGRGRDGGIILWPR